MTVLLFIKSFFFRFTLILLLFIVKQTAYSQLSFVKPEEVSISIPAKYESTIAYKIPFSGNNYKFYSSMNYYISGKAFAGCRVHNTLIEAYHISERTCKNAHFKILKGSSHKLGRLQPSKPEKNGYHFYFMTPMKKKDKPLKYYYRTGAFRSILKYNKKGELKSNKNIEIDFESMAQHILDIDNAGTAYGIKIKKIIFNRFYLDELFKTEAGKKLQSRDIYFAKFLSKKVNRIYDDIYYIEFMNKE